MRRALAHLVFSAIVSFGLLSVLCLAQTEDATISGRVTDQTGAVVAGASVQLQSAERGTTEETITNGGGIYLFSAVHPGVYHISVRKEGFHQVDYVGLTANVQAHIEQNFKLPVGSVSESVTVTGDTHNVNTMDATVSTVVDRQFAENLPMNGRSFQTLIQLTPGVVLTPNNGSDTGQFSINGQRAASNYWMVDGVSANVGITAGGAGNGLGGAAASTSVLGGTNSLVSVDALQEFRIQTSTYAPEFGRMPGGQISIVTRSGTNSFHGTLFEYIRNDVLDANDWFADFAKQPKPEERQNDFGGTLNGPVWRDRTFFFFSYEGLRLRLPQTRLTEVPCDQSCNVFGNARANADPQLQPYLNAFPLPNGPEAIDAQGDPTGAADFNASFSDKATLDAYSVRVDHKLNEKISIFGRYNYSPSELNQRGGGAEVDALSTVVPSKVSITTVTAGANWSLSPIAANDLRFNYSSTASSSRAVMDNFGGSVPLATLPFPPSFTAQNANFAFFIFSLGNSSVIEAGTHTYNRQRQINLVDSVSMQRNTHALKFGVDFRRLSPELRPNSYLQQASFADVPSAQTGTTFFNFLTSSLPATLEFRNLSLFVQDTWRTAPRLTLTYGIRWDVDFAPSAISGPNFSAAKGFNLHDLTGLTLAPAGTSPYRTTYGNIAPRLGAAYQLFQSQHWQTVLRGGFGLFYDLASSEAGNLLMTDRYPFGAFALPVSNFPLSSQDAMPPAIVPPTASNFGVLFAFNPHLKLPYTLQWNVAVEQAVGSQQTITASYVGSSGRRLLQTAFVLSPNQNYAAAQLVSNGSTSDYNAFQLQFQRRLTAGLQALASYSWSHSIDTASAGSLGTGSNALTSLSASVNRGPSDFDVRNAFSAGLSYEVPFPKTYRGMRTILEGWSTESVVQARSAPPVDVFYSGIGLLSSGFFTNVRPDITGQPFYLYGAQYPDGKAFNPAAFTSPPIDPVTNLPSGQGNLSRNALRGFGAAQWDFAVHRQFQIHQSIQLQFRAELFNLVNHPNFGQPVGDLGTPAIGGNPAVQNPQFGISTQTLGQSLSGGNVGGGALAPLYQIGGPRSVQFALKLTF